VPKSCSEQEVNHILEFGERKPEDKIFGKPRRERISSRTGTLRKYYTLMKFTRSWHVDFNRGNKLRYLFD